MGNYGIRISRPGFDVKTANPEQLAFNSKYKTLKIHSRGSGSLTDSARLATIPHNLGYVPFFLVHTDEDDGKFYINPNISGEASDPHNLNGEKDIVAYADDTNLYIKANDGFGWDFYDTGLSDDDYDNNDDSGCDGGWTEVGEDDGLERGGIRFQDVTIPQGTTVYRADVAFYIYTRQGSADVKVTIKGIDEDNCGTFPCSDGKPKTSASYSATCSSSLGSGETWATDVKNIVNEILGRGGWSSGNHLGIFFEDNGSDNDTSIYTQRTDEPIVVPGTDGSKSYLKVLLKNALCDYKYTIFLNQIE